MLKKYMLFRVASALLSNPEKEYSLRTMAKAADVGISTSKRCLDYLVDRHVATRKQIGNQFRFSLNNSFLLTKQLKVLKILSELEYSGLIKELIELFNPSSILLYGTCASGEYGGKSDVDLLIISKNKSKKTIQSSIRREVNYQVYAPNEWRDKARKDKVFYDNVITNCISLYGEKPVVL